MRVAMDARMLRPGTMHGIARYVYQLLSCFRAAKDLELFVLVNRSNFLLEQSWPEHIRFVPVKAGWISFKEQVELNLLLRRLRIDIFHSPSFVAPFFCPTRMVMTIHDLNHLVLPQFYTPLHALYYHFVVKRCVQQSQYIFTVSHFSKGELHRHLGVPEDRILVTHNGVSSAYCPVTDADQLCYVRELYGLPESFLFCLSNNKPHKNIDRLVAAFGASSLELPLVLAMPFDRKLVDIADAFGKKYLLYFTKFIEEEHLPAVYSMTDLFVFPSTYEGFGLPPLEALACGAPVLVSQAGSLPEIVGEHGAYMDPHSEQEMSRALENHFAHAQSPEQAVKRTEHAHSFSWDTMAAQTIAGYTKAMQSPYPPVAHPCHPKVEVSSCELA